MRVAGSGILVIIILTALLGFPFTAAEMAQLRVRVVDMSGNPLVKASVSVTRPRPAPALLWAGETDSLGNFSFGIELGTPIVIHVDWMGVVVAEVSAIANPQGLLVVASVKDLTVSVFDQRAEPVGGCEVQTLWSGPQGNVSWAASTGLEGSAVFRQIPSSFQLAENLTVLAKKMGVTLVGPLSLRPSAEGWHVTLRCEVYDLNVSVQDIAGRPAEGAEVGASLNTGRLSGRADSEGKVAFRQLPLGDYEVVSTLGAFTSTSQVSLNSHRLLTMVLPFVHNYSVTFLCGWDDGLKGSGLRAELRGTSSQFDFLTDSSGSSQLSLPYGSYNLTVFKGPRTLGLFRINVTADAEVECLLNNTLRVWELAMTLRSTENRTVDGTVLISLQGVEIQRIDTFGGKATAYLKVGDYKLTARVTGYDATERTVSINADTEVQLVLAPTTSLLSSPLVSAAVLIASVLLTALTIYGIYSRRSQETPRPI